MFSLIYITGLKHSQEEDETRLLHICAHLSTSVLLFYCDEVMKRSSSPPFIARVTGKMSNFLKWACCSLFQKLLQGI